MIHVACAVPNVGILEPTLIRNSRLAVDPLRYFCRRFAFFSTKSFHVLQKLSTVLFQLVFSVTRQWNCEAL
jgi:hypothetical protein